MFSGGIKREQWQEMGQTCKSEIRFFFRKKYNLAV